MNTTFDGKNRPDRSPFFPDWPVKLQADPSLTPGLRESYRQTVLRFLQFCRQRRAEVTVALARDYVQLAQLERAPSPGRLQEWKDGLNWFFRQGREAAAVALQGVPPLARSDLGQTDWEAALIARIRLKQFSWRTEQTYRGWMWRFARFLERANGIDTSPSVPLPGRGGEGRRLEEAGGAEVREFLTKLAVEERVGVATQRQALNALVFYFREAAGKELGDLGDFARARKRVRVPVVLNRTECERLFEAMAGTPRLMAELMFGSGIRLMELLRLRVKDVDLERGQLVVRGGKGDQDRVTVLPERLQEQLRAHRERLRRLHAEDRDKRLPGYGSPRGWNASTHTRANSGNGSGSGRRAN